MIVKQIPDMNKNKQTHIVYKRIKGKIEEAPATFAEAMVKAFKEQEMINEARHR
jgi:hypothetical protein